MTCIVGIVHKRRVFIGADGLASDSGFNCSVRVHPKVFSVNGKFLIGGSGSCRQNDLLRYGFTPPEQRDDQADHQYMCTAFVDAIRECLRKGGLTIIENNQEKCLGFFLVAYRGHLYEIETDFQVAEVAEEYNAVGCGAPYAQGSLATSPRSRHPRMRILSALKAAEKFSAGVRRPFTILEAPK